MLFTVILQKIIMSDDIFGKTEQKLILHPVYRIIQPCLPKYVHDIST